MLQQAFLSIIVGLTISALAFIPLLIWHYRRYGELAEGRLLWTMSCYVYFSALIAYTIFPLPTFTDEFCAAHSLHVNLDPFRGIRDIVRLLPAYGFPAILHSWLILEPILNVALFVPFGFLIRRLTEWPRLRVALLGLGMSALIETTQYTANFGLAPCAYRVTDAVDLITNTTGTLVGIALEALTPRLLSRKDYVIARRDQARTLSRMRRLAGMIIDATYLALLGMLGTAVGWGAAIVLNWHQSAVDAVAEHKTWLAIGSCIAAGIGVIIPALTDSGASFGQRMVYLEPQAQRHSRASQLLRALICQGIFVVTINFAPGFAWLIALASVIVVLINPSGISGLLSGCHFVDSRAKNFPVGTEAISSIL
ncbi:MAG: VanZ family protein [Propionibacteriaceae bacterium]